MRNQALLSSVVMTVIAALIWAGCGSSADDSLTKADFIRKANTICSKWQQARDQRLGPAQSKFAPLTNRVNQEKAILYIMSAYQNAVSGLGELSPPAGEEKKVGTFLKAMEEAMAQVKKEPLTATEKSLFKKSNELVDSYGLDQCKV